MREYPVFVPFGDEHLAAVLAVPDDEPRALVGLLQGGGGAPKSHRHSIWRRTAEGLAEIGVASVRMDWLGIGDSTGQAHFSLHHPPVEEAVAVMRFAVDALRIETIGLAGNCLGARTALDTAGQFESCRSVALIMLKPLSHPGRSRAEGLVAADAAAGEGSAAATAPQRARRGGAVARMLRRVPALDALARRAYWRMQWRRAAPMLHQISDARKRGQVLIMEDGAEKKKGRLQHALGALRKRDHLEPFELRDLPGGAVRVFDDIERQAFVIDTLVEWFDRTLPGTATGTAGRPVPRPLAEASEGTG